MELGSHNMLLSFMGLRGKVCYEFPDRLNELLLFIESTEANGASHFGRAGHLNSSQQKFRSEIPNKKIIQKLITDTSTKTQYPTYAVRLAWRTGSISIQNEAVD